MESAESLFTQPWEELQTRAWQTRVANFPPLLGLAVPGARKYDTECYTNTPHHFAAISLTGKSCALDCAHCNRQLLETMYPAPSPQDLRQLARRLKAQGCEGVLISGGADARGAVPLRRHLPAIAEMKALGLTVIVHTGLIDAPTAQGLHEAGVDQALFDVIGHSDTIREVYGLPYTPQDYERSLATLRQAGLTIAPHVVIGLHYGQLRGELNALEIIRRVGADVLVLVVLRPLPGSAMAETTPPTAESVGKITAVARLMMPRTKLTLGCARPAGRLGAQMGQQAIKSGVNIVAYPHPDTVRLAKKLGLKTEFIESCCTLLPTI